MEKRAKDDAVVAAAKRNRIQVCLVFFMALSTVLYAGAFYGWGPMQLMLEQNGAFSSKCENYSGNGNNSKITNSVCAKQTSSLLTVQLVAMMTMLLCPFLGAIADHYGPVALMNFLSFSGCLGIALLMVAASFSGTDYLLYIAFSCLGIMANSVSIMIVQTGMVFHDANIRRRVISSLNTLYDAGGITYLGLWAIGDGAGLSLKIISGIYLLIAFVVFGGGMYSWRVVMRLSTNSHTDTDPTKGNGSLSASSLDLNDDVIHDIQLNINDTDPCTNPIEPRGKMEDTTPIQDDENCTTGEMDGENAVDNGSTKLPTQLTEEYVLISTRPPYEQLKSGQFVMLLVFFSFHVARNVYTLTTARDFLGYLGDDSMNNKYLAIFTLLMPLSVVGLPFVDHILKVYGHQAGIHGINILAIAHGVIQVSSENLNVQVFGFIVFSFYRCFIYSVVFTFLPTFISGNVLGKGIGWLIVGGGVFTLINIPLANLAVNLLIGNFFWPNFFYTVSVLPFIYVACRISQGIKKEKQASLRVPT